MDMKEQHDSSRQLETGEVILLTLSMGSVLAALHFFLNSVF